MTRTSLKNAMQRLCQLSVQHAYDPFRDFCWPAKLPPEGPWMSRDLLSPFGTRWMDDLSEAELCRLSRWELINFFSFNVHGIRELMLHVLTCIHKSGNEDVSEYFHHFLDEENKHMWFFAEFCNRYGGKIYFTQKVHFPTFAEEDIQGFIAFAKILISEQISDFYNIRMMADASLPEIVRQINRVHHEDESRHIAMGLRIVGQLRADLHEKYPAETCRRIDDYLSRYMQFFIESFYNPAAYRDAGFGDPYGWRRRLIDTPERKAFHARVLARTIHFFTRTGSAAREAC